MSIFPFVVLITSNRTMSMELNIKEDKEEEFNKVLKEQIETLKDLIEYTISTLEFPTKKLTVNEAESSATGIGILKAVEVDFNYQFIDEDQSFPATVQVTFGDAEVADSVTEEDFERIFRAIFDKIMDFIEEYMLVEIYPFCDRVLH